MTTQTKMVAIAAWLSVIFIVALFLTPLDKLFLKGVTTGYEGALGRLLVAVLISLLLSVISVILGLTALFSKSIQNKSKFLLPFSVGPLISLIAFIIFLIIYPRWEKIINEEKQILHNKKIEATGNNACWFSVSGLCPCASFKSLCARIW